MITNPSDLIREFGQHRLGIIGGTGLYRLPGLDNRREIQLTTPFGPPSAPLIIGDLHGVPAAFLARHGHQHTIPPHQVNYRANIYVLKMLGVQRLISVSACGSLRQDYAPGDLVIPHQLVDHTQSRQTTFFDQDLAAHVSVDEPFCPGLSRLVFQAAQEADTKVHSGGTMITISGPRFSTKAESDIFRSWAVDIIGMTTSPEAFLAREAEMCYAVLAHVTDYDVWLAGEKPVSTDYIRRNLRQNTELINQALSALAQDTIPTGSCGCSSALKTAIATPLQQIAPKTRERLSLLIGKYIQGEEE
jgi:5'-methylthioadenosine phosphorylase